MATTAQLAAARKAAEAYQAAKKSWDTEAAKSIYSNAAKTLWVSDSSANKIYKENTWGSWTSWWDYSKVSSWAYKTDEYVSQPKPTQADTQTPVLETTTNLPFSKDNKSYKQLIAKGYDDTKIMEMYNKAKADSAALVANNKPAEPATIEPTNIEPATIEPVKPAEMVKPAKTDVWVLAPLELSEYQDDSSARQNEIVSNLNSYRQTNPEFLTDLDTFKKTFSYWLRSDEQKELLNNRYLGYQKWVKLNNMWTDSIVAQYWSWNISSSDLEQLRLNNPAKYQEAMAAIEQKDIVRTYQNELYKTDEQKTIMAQLDEVSWQGSIFDEYKKTINSEEVIWLQSEIADMETQREQLNLELNDIQDQVEKRYEWTGATKGKIAYIVAKESAALQKQITSLWIDSANRVDKYNSIVNTASETMQLQLQEQEAERAARNQKMSELWFYYEYDPVGMAERAENIFNIENPDINSPDANTARRALNNELTKYYEQYGDIIIRPQSQALNDIIAQAKTDWTSLSAALKKNFTDQLQSKQLYGQTLGKSLGFDMGSYSMTQQADWNWTVWAKTTYWAWSVAWTPWTAVMPSGNLTNITSTAGKTIQIDSVAAPSLQSAFDEIWSWLVVWQWHRDQVQTIKSMASKFWIPFNEANPAETAKALSAAGHQVAVPWGSKHETGMAVDLYDANGNAPSADQVAILNAKWWYQTAGAWDMGHFEYTWWSTEWSTTFDTWLEWYYNKFANAKMTTADYDFVEWLWITKPEFVKQASAYKKAKDAEIKPMAEMLLTQIEWLKNLSGMEYQKLRVWTPWEWQDLRGYYDRILNSQALKYLVDIKAQGATFGALSDRELNTITSASTNLRLRGSKERFDEILNEMAASLTKWITSIWWTTTTAPTTPFDFLGWNNNIGSSRMSNLNSLID